MSRTTRYLTRMILFMIAVVLFAIAAVLYAGLENAFNANPLLNGVIITVTLIGAVYTIRSVLVLNPEIHWIQGLQRRGEGQPLGQSRADTEPSLLAPMARMIGERQGQLVMSALSMRSLLDGIGARLSETREISRYLIGLLILLGLLGTFWGLVQTIAAVADVIRDLSIDPGNVNADSGLALAFGELKDGLEAPLAGMGTAFSSSLFGLAGSMVLGFLELQASQAQNTFYKELEDWLAGAARVTTGATGDLADTGSGAPVPAYLQATVEQMAENLDRLARIVTHGEDARRESAGALLAMTEQLGTLNDHMRTQQSVMVRVAESQLELKPLLQRLTVTAEQDGFGIDEATRQHLRNMESHLARLTDHMGHHRDYLVSEIRAEIKLLARTIAALAEEPTD